MQCFAGGFEFTGSWPPYRGCAGVCGAARKKKAGSLEVKEECQLHACFVPLWLGAERMYHGNLHEHLWAAWHGQLWYDTMAPGNSFL